MGNFFFSLPFVFSHDLRDQYSKTALMYAIELGDDDIVANIIKSGANVNILNKNGENAMFYAVRKGNKKYVKWLIKAGVDITIQDKFGFTALTLAITDYKIECARILSTVNQRARRVN